MGFLLIESEKLRSAPLVSLREFIEALWLNHLSTSKLLDEGFKVSVFFFSIAPARGFLESREVCLHVRSPTRAAMLLASNLPTLVSLLQCFSRRQSSEKAMPHQLYTGRVVVSRGRLCEGTPILTRQECASGLGGPARRINMAPIA